MDRRIKKILSIVLIVVIVAISAYVPEIKGNATDASKVYGAELDLSNVTADTNIVNGGDSQVLDALMSEVYTIDGTRYKNYAIYSGTSIAASSERESVYNAIDWNKGSSWVSESSGSQYLQIDFGNTYLIKDIAIYWGSSASKNYDVEVSVDGRTFETLTNVTSSYGKRTDDIKLSEEISVRTVRIKCASGGSGNAIYEIGIYGSESPKKSVSVLQNLKIKDYYKYTGKYLLYFREEEDSSGYNVYLDDGETPIKEIEGSGASLSASDLAGVSEGKHTLYVANLDADGNETARIGAEFTISGTAGTYGDVAQIYIYTDKSITNDYHDDNDVTISVVDKDGGEYEELYDDECNIKIRGNTTAAAPKKPWNIKFSGKKDVLGMGKGKKWCILANSFDKSLMRNRLSYDLGAKIGITYNCENRYVEVYVNGTFNGNYLITEPVEAKKERVDIDAYNADNKDMLLEVGTRNEPDVNHFTTSVLGTTFDINDPEKDGDLPAEQLSVKISRVKTYLNKFETALRSQDYDEIVKYIDEYTFVNFYIVNELFKNVDFNLSSTRFYIKGDKIYAGPMWDLDLSSGNCKSSYYKEYYVDGVSYKGYYCQGMSWYEQLLKNETFYNKVKERYKDLQYYIQDLYLTDPETEISITGLVNTYGNSFERNYLSASALGAGWSLTNDDGYSYSGESGWNNWKQPIEFLRTWLQNRNAWLCSEWGIDMETAYEESKLKKDEILIPETPSEPTTPEVTTPEPSTPDETTTEKETPVETTTENIVVPTTKNQAVKVGKTKVKKATKKKGTKKVKISLKKIKGASGYVVKISTSKKFKGKKKTITKKFKKNKIIFKSKKLKKDKIYYIKARAFKKVNGVTYYGKWSNPKKIKLK